MKLHPVRAEPPTVVDGKTNDNALRFDCVGCGAATSIKGDDLAYVDLDGPVKEARFTCAPCFEMGKMVTRVFVAADKGPRRTIA